MILIGLLKYVNKNVSDYVLYKTVNDYQSLNQLGGFAFTTIHPIIHSYRFINPETKILILRSSIPIQDSNVPYLNIRSWLNTIPSYRGFVLIHQW
jgi:hypothetical protein